MPTSTRARPTVAPVVGQAARPASPIGPLLSAPVLVSALLAVSWWQHRSTGTGAVATGIGQVAGLAAAVLALGTVALMARVPIVTHVLGADRAIRWHRRTASTMVVMVVVHVAAITLGYALADGSSLWSEVVALLTDYPDMITAAAATVLLGLVTVSSIRAVRRRFPYESWLFTHWYSYVAIALAFGHELSVGASFVGASLPTLAWTWLHLFVAGLVGWYRVAVPAWRMLTHRLEVVAVEPAGGGTAHLVLAGRGLDDYCAVSGQHVRIRFLTREGWWQSHPFSFSATPRPDRWRITVEANGDYTPGLLTVPVGTRAAVSGVYGHLVPHLRTRPRVALIGGGSGILPLRAILESLPAEVDVRVLYRAGAPERLIAVDELEWFARHRGTHIDYLVGSRHPDPNADVLSPAGLRHVVPDMAARDVFICGQASFVRTVTRSLRTIGVPAANVHTERFDP